MGYRLRLAGLGALWALSACATASDSWQVVSSKNFAIHTDGDVETAKARVLTLEAFRAYVLATTTSAPPEGLPPFLVLAPNRMRAYPELDPRHAGIAGYYIADEVQPFAVFSLSNDSYLEALHVALHEYVHYVQFQAGAPRMPRWYVEGLAEYLSAVEVKASGQLVVGGVHQVRLDALRSYDWQRTEDIWREKVVYGRLYYEQAWILVHYLVNEDPKALAGYLRAFAKDPETARFEDFFDFSFEELHARLRRYVDSGSRFRVRSFQPPPAPPVAVAAWAKAEREYQLQHVGRYNMKLEELEAAVANHPPGALAWLALAEALVAEKKFDEALRLLDIQIAAAPNEARFVARKAAILTRHIPEGTSPKEAKARHRKALKLAAEANRDRPEDVLPFVVIVEAGLAGGGVSTKTMAAAIETARVLAPHRLELGLLEATLRRKMGALDEARRLAQEVRTAAGHPALRSKAEALLAELGPDPDGAGADSTQPTYAPGRDNLRGG